MYCPNCGRKNNGRHEYCPGCGQKLNITDSEPEKEIDWRIVFIAVFAVLFIICGIILLELYRRNTGDHGPGGSGTEASAGGTGKTEQSPSDKTDDPGDTVEPPGSVKPENLDIEDGAVTFGNPKHSYYIFEGNCDSWGDAKKYCESRGGYLAVINNEEEDNFLFEYMRSTGRRAAYFGFSDIELTGDWKWVGNRKSSYTNWGVNDDGQQEPNKASVDERYAEYDTYLIQPGGTWNDCGFGRDTKAYICEWDYEP